LKVSIEEIIQFLSGSWWAGLSGLIGVAALLIGIYYERSKKRKESIKHAIENRTTLGNNIIVENSNLIPDISDISKLAISNDDLDQMYEEAKNYAVLAYDDAIFTQLAIQVYPFMTSKVSVYFDFYSKWAKKTYTYRFTGNILKGEHGSPDKVVNNNSEIKAFHKLPWKINSNWLDFIQKTYKLVGPFAPSLGSNYILYGDPPNNDYYWRIIFDDDFNGKNYTYEWKGGKIDESTIKKIIS